jgi:hypothetical protein
MRWAEHQKSKKFKPIFEGEKEALKEKEGTTLDQFYKIKREVEQVMLEEGSESTPLDFVPESDPPHHRREKYSALLHGRDSPRQKAFLLDADSGEIVKLKKKKKEHWLRV